VVENAIPKPNSQRMVKPFKAITPQAEGAKAAENTEYKKIRVFTNDPDTDNAPPPPLPPPSPENDNYRFIFWLIVCVLGFILWLLLRIFA
jgi:hypothetical protein